jgi:hypothetical protein
MILLGADGQLRGSRWVVPLIRPPDLDLGRPGRDVAPIDASSLRVRHLFAVA